MSCGFGRSSSRLNTAADRQLCVQIPAVHGGGKAPETVDDLDDVMSIDESGVDPMCVGDLRCRAEVAVPGHETSASRAFQEDDLDRIVDVLFDAERAEYLDQGGRTSGLQSQRGRRAQ